MYNNIWLPGSNVITIYNVKVYVHNAVHAKYVVVKVLRPITCKQA